MYSISEGRKALSRVDLHQGLDVAEVETRLQLGLRLHETGQRILAFYLVEMTERRLHLEGGFSSTAGYAERRLGLDRRRVAELVSVGRKLLTLKVIDRAFCEQRLGWAKLLHIVRVASPEHEDAWLARALELTCRELALEVRLSKPGAPPRDPADRKGLPEVRFRMAYELSALTHQKVDLAKRKLAAELGRPVNDAEYVDVLSELFLNLEEDGTVKGRTRVSASLYRIVLRPEDEGSTPPDESLDRQTGRLLMDTEDGPIPIEAPALCCDAETHGQRDVKTSASLRRKVLERDGQRCRCCGGRWRLMAHHIRFLSQGGRTRAHNLISVCATCHALVHEGMLVLDGERQEDVRFLDREGKPLHESGKTVDPAHLLLLAMPEASPMPVPQETMPPKTVTLQSVPDVVDSGWWRRHSHLIRFLSGKGLEFQPGVLPEEPVPKEQAPEEPGPSTIHASRLEGVGDGKAFDTLVGLDDVVARLRTAATGSRRRGKGFPHTLFVGPPGTGKTTLARGVASAYSSGLHATSGPLLEDTHALVRLLASLEQGDILFIDEVHAVPRPVLEVLYEAMAGGHLDLTLHAGALARGVRLDLPAFTLLAATTEEGDLPSALRSRFGRRESLGYYATKALAAIAKASAERQGVALRRGAASLIALHARGTPRETLRLVECVLDETAGLACATLDRITVQGALRRLGYDGEALDPTEQRYLGLLRESAVPIPLGRLARMLGASARTLAEHLEPHLFRRGLVRMTAQGRQAVRLAPIAGYGT